MKYHAAAVLSLCFMAMTPARAADNCTGTDTLVTDIFDVTDLGQGVKQTFWKAKSIVTSNDSIYKLVVGECSATMLTTPDGKTQSMGFCSRHDNDGDTQSISIQQAAGADRNQWASIGGTGKYAGHEGSGWAQPILADGSVLVVKWGGNCK